MKEYISMGERYKDEVLTDNVALNLCAQCEGCKWQNDGTVWSSDFRKSSCIMYPYPNFKPLKVIRNEGFCRYRKEAK